MRMLDPLLTQLTGGIFPRKEINTIRIMINNHFHMSKHQTSRIPISSTDPIFPYNLKMKDLGIHSPRIKPIKSLI